MDRIIRAGDIVSIGSSTTEYAVWLAQDGHSQVVVSSLRLGRSRTVDRSRLRYLSTDSALRAKLYPFAA